jgi:MscS family membrane protein
MPNSSDTRSNTTCLADLEDRSFRPGKSILLQYGCFLFSTEKCSRQLFWLTRVLLAAACLLCSQLATSQILKQPVSASKSPDQVEQRIMDPLGRDTPRGALVGFLKYVRRGDYSTAARFLQAPAGKKGELEARAQELQELMDLSFKGNVDFASDRPEGTLDDGLSPDRERVGVLNVDDQRVNLVLVRVDEASSKVWLISKESVTESQFLYKELRPSEVMNYVPEILTAKYFLSISAIQWIGWLLSIPFAYWFSWCVLFAIDSPFRLVRFLRKTSASPTFPRFKTPLRYTIAIVLHGFVVYFIRLPLFYRVYYIRVLVSLLLIGFFWLLSRLVAVVFERGMWRVGGWGASRASLMILLSRLIRVFVAVVGVLSIATALGFDTKAMLAGVGIGGLAIALAGQKTLENVIGGASLLLDKAVHVGDLCRIENKLGIVEDIGLRSLRLRMVDQTVVVVPNGVLAQVQFENLTSRAKILIQDTFSVRIETSMDQLRSMLDAVQQILDQNVLVEKSTSRIRIVRFSGAAIELELFAYLMTSDWVEFTTSRQNIFLAMFETLERFGIKFAGPTQINYLETTSQSKIAPLVAEPATARSAEVSRSATAK